MPTPEGVTARSWTSRSSSAFTRRAAQRSSCVLASATGTWASSQSSPLPCVASLASARRVRSARPAARRCSSSSSWWAGFGLDEDSHGRRFPPTPLATSRDAQAELKEVLPDGGIVVWSPLC